ncbi:MAG: DUF2975 domain-containing protein [Bacteroidaceae bacterium]|nr:DUF2975 domain-containing protein [Bacteroidaceae bacterium]
MKRKLKIYTALLFIVLLIEVFGNTFGYRCSSWSADPENELSIGPLPDDFATTKEVKGGVATYFKPTLSIDVKVNAWEIAPGKYLVCNAGEKSCRLDIQKAKVNIPVERVKGTFLFYYVTANGLLIIVLGICLLVIAFKIIRSVYRGEVFVSKVSRQMETAGIVMVVIQLIYYIGAYVATQLILKHVDIAYLNISMDDSKISYFIILGLILMIFSQIILMGKDLKEEQELTI